MTYPPSDEIVVDRRDRRDLSNDEIVQLISVILTNWGSGCELQASLDAIADEINDDNYLKIQNFLVLFLSLLELIKEK